MMSELFQEIQFQFFALRLTMSLKWQKRKNSVLTLRFLSSIGLTLMRLRKPQMLFGKILKMLMIQITVFTGMEPKVTKPPLQDFLSPGIYKLVKIFLYHSEPTQQPAAGLGPTGTRQDGPLIAKLNLI